MIVDIKKKSVNPCPKCGASSIPVVYGYPGAKTIRMLEAGRIELGCCLHCPTTSPGWACTKCEHWWGTLEEAKSVLYQICEEFDSSGEAK